MYQGGQAIARPLASFGKEGSRPFSNCVSKSGEGREESPDAFLSGGNFGVKMVAGNARLRAVRCERGANRDA